MHKFEFKFSFKKNPPKIGLNHDHMQKSTTILLQTRLQVKIPKKMDLNMAPSEKLQKFNPNGALHKILQNFSPNKSPGKNPKKIRFNHSFMQNPTNYSFF